jgi:NADH-quinone oxidoreductase subunit J
MEAVLFWIFAAGAVGSALAVVFHRNPVSSALSLVVAFIFLAALFGTLEAFVLAMVQIIVYAGAVMVLFLFIIMLLDLKVEQRQPIPWVSAFFVLLIAAGFGILFTRVLQAVPGGDSVLKWGTGEGMTTAVDLGRLLFTKYLLPFEVTGVLLLVATVGVVLLSRRSSR